MSQNQRNQNLFGVQDWQSTYQAMRDADFKSYDYVTLRKAMVDHLRLYNPENFNDYVNSSEYISLIDLIAYMGQSLSFRMDLNARENFLDTAKRRDSVTRLAKMSNYIPKRNLAANGFLRIDSIRTDDSVTDSFGNNLGNITVNWNDTNNVNWFEQWNSIINAVISSSLQVGKPSKSATIDGVYTAEYSIDMPSVSFPPFGYTALVDNTQMPFEIVNPTITNGTTITELGSSVRSIFNLLFRDDRRGYSSNGTGYFLNFRQGTLGYEQFGITESIPNRNLSLTASGINDTDLWVYQINSDGSMTQWTQVDTVAGSTLSFNSVSTATDKKVFSVTSQTNDTVTLNFGDGVFSEIPLGTFIVYYRVSNGLTYRISPSEMNGVQIRIPYVGKSGRTQFFSIVASLTYTVANSAARQTVDDIKLRAPQSYYTQNRMVNGQDYNSFPFTQYSNIVKIKAVNRTSSGISRYLDVIDTTGRYSSTNIICDDGFLYQDPSIQTSTFTSSNINEIVGAVNNIVIPVIENHGLLTYFYTNYAKANNTDATWNKTVIWSSVLVDNDYSSGYLYDPSATDTTQAIHTNDPIFGWPFSKFTEGAILKFVPPPGQIFDAQNKLVIQQGTVVQQNQKTEIYATVKSISYFGQGNQGLVTVGTRGRDTNGNGAILITSKVPTGAVLAQVYPAFTPILPSNVQVELIQKLGNGKTVGLGYTAGTNQNVGAGTWFIIDNPVSHDFVEPTNTQATQTYSWLVMFSNVGSTYTMSYRSIKYFFGSLRQTRFFYDSTIKIYDPVSGKLLKDRIDVLKTNPLPILNTGFGFSNDIPMNVYRAVTETDGFLDDTKIQVTYADNNSDGSPDQPNFYTDIVGTELTAGPFNSRVFFIDDSLNSGISMLALPAGTVLIASSKTEIENNLYNYVNGSIVFDSNLGQFWQILNVAGSASVTSVTGYTWRWGRQNIQFQYRHNAPSDRRIDPSPSNIIDVYVLGKSYADDYATWIQDTTGTVVEPTSPTSESLHNDYADLEKYRMVSDLMVYSPAIFKPLFGSKAKEELRAQIVAVKNTQVVVSDSEIKSQIITAMNEYFDPVNWDFGETFFFSDLATYLHTRLNSILSSVHLVPTSAGQVYGDMQQIRSLPNEILISAATVSDVVVVTNLTAANLRTGI